jgi:hypothetical protein
MLGVELSIMKKYEYMYIEGSKNVLKPEECLPFRLTTDYHKPTWHIVVAYSFTLTSVQDFGLLIHMSRFSAGPPFVGFNSFYMFKHFQPTYKSVVTSLFHCL